MAQYDYVSWNLFLTKEVPSLFVGVANCAAVVLCPNGSIVLLFSGLISTFILSSPWEVNCSNDRCLVCFSSSSEFWESTRKLAEYIFGSFLSLLTGFDLFKRKATLYFI